MDLLPLDITRKAKNLEFISITHMLLTPLLVKHTDGHHETKENHKTILSREAPSLCSKHQRDSRSGQEEAGPALERAGKRERKNWVPVNLSYILWMPESRQDPCLWEMKGIWNQHQVLPILNPCYLSIQCHAKLVEKKTFSWKIETCRKVVAGICFAF